MSLPIPHGNSLARVFVNISLVLDIIWFLLYSCWLSFCLCYPFLPFPHHPLELPFTPALFPSHPFIFCLSVSLWSLPLTLISGHSSQLGLFASYNYIENSDTWFWELFQMALLSFLTLVFSWNVIVFSHRSTNDPSKVELYMTCAQIV